MRAKKGIPKDANQSGPLAGGGGGGDYGGSSSSSSSSSISIVLF